MNWLGGSERAFDCAVKVRSMRPPVAARVDAAADERTARSNCSRPKTAVAPGQACVFYERDGTRVLGGGWIARAEAARKAA